MWNYVKHGKEVAGFYLLPPWANKLTDKLYSSQDETCKFEVKCKQIGGCGGGVADNEVYTVRTVNIITQRQCLVARCSSSYVVMSLVYTVYAFVFLLHASDYDLGKAHTLVPASVLETVYTDQHETGSTYCIGQGIIQH